MTTQRTLTGKEAQFDKMQLPGTFVECDECGDVMLRSQRFDHEHEVSPASIRTAPASEDENDDEDDEPEELGSYYSVTLEYSVTYRFKVPAWSEHEAKDIAKDWKLDARPADSYHIHSETSEGKTITTQDVPDDYDEFGSELLHEALYRQQEEAGDE